jgi:Protein of unknown function (DUF3800)
MSRVYVFADEAGNFDFSTKRGATRWFILGSITTDDPAIGDRLLALRRELAWQGVALDSTFHATEDLQVVRDEVFRLLAAENFRIDYTLMEKRKTMPHLQNMERFYKQTWFTHFKYVAKDTVKRADELLVVAAWIGTKKRRRTMRVALEDVVDQSAWWCQSYRAAFWPAESDPCLQVADYVTWAVQRKYELGDKRSYDLIKDKISTEFRPFDYGSTTYY